MLNSGRIIGILLLLAVAGNGSLSAQRGMRDTTRTDSLRAGMNDRRMRSMDRSTDLLRIRDMRNRINSEAIRGARQGMRPMRDPGIRGRNSYPMRGMRGVRQMPPWFNMRRGSLYIPADPRVRSFMGQNRRGIDSTLNFTEEQKKEITDLRKQQQDEMNKLRDEMSERMRILREKQRNELLEQLTEEQKKASESRLR